MAGAGDRVSRRRRRGRAHLVSGGKGTLDVPGGGPLIVDAGRTGSYRTLYAPSQFDEVRDALAKLEAIDQLGMFSDVSAFGMSRLQTASDYLDLAAAGHWKPIRELGRDRRLRPPASMRTTPAMQRLGRSSARSRIAELAPVFARIGWSAQAGEAVR